MKILSIAVITLVVTLMSPELSNVSLDMTHNSYIQVLWLVWLIFIGTATSIRIGYEVYLTGADSGIYKKHRQKVDNRKPRLYSVSNYSR